MQRPAPLKAASTTRSALHPRQPGWSQWQASAVTFFESWQIWLQYFCLSGAMQLQAGCAHFFVPAIPVPPYLLLGRVTIGVGFPGINDIFRDLSQIGLFGGPVRLNRLLGTGFRVRVRTSPHTIESRGEDELSAGRSPRSAKLFGMFLLQTPTSSSS